MSESAHPSIAGLIADLESPSAKVVETAAETLARARVVEAIPALMRTLARAADPTRAHAAAEALAGLRVTEAVPLILDRIEDPVFTYYSGSLVFHVVELDCRAHLDRLAEVLVRDGIESCANACSHFKHRRGPIPRDVEQRCLQILSDFADEFEAGGHRDSPSRYHADPEERWQTVAWAHDLVLEWNDREHVFPRKGENRSTGDITPDWTPITVDGLRELIALQMPDLDAEDRATWRHIAVDPPERIRGIRRVAQAAPEQPGEFFIVARAGDALLLYDDVQDGFWKAEVNPDGTVSGAWGVETEDLELLVSRFADDDE